MRRAAHASAAARRSTNTHRKSAGSSSLSSSLHPDIDDGDGGDEGENDPLLDPENTNQANLPERCREESIFPLLQVIRQDVRATIDTHLDWDELTSLDLNCKCGELPGR